MSSSESASVTRATESNNHIVGEADTILVTGAAGFIGSRVVASLLRMGFTRVRCLVRPSSNADSLKPNGSAAPDPRLEIVRGNLLSKDDCRRITQGAKVILHLAAGRGEKSYADAYMNSVVATRNLLDAAVADGGIRRFVCVSSFVVYSTRGLKRMGTLDETCSLEDQPHLTGEAYCYAKAMQEDIVREYGARHGLPFVLVRPGVVYGPGNKGLTGRVGIGTFGLFLHLGGRNPIPLTFVENCADAIVLAGLVQGVDSEAFNVVDDNPPTSRTLLGLYKRNVRRFRSLYVPYPVGYFLSYLWEKYSERSEGQIPMAFNRRKWINYWKGCHYSNDKLKKLLGWQQRVPFQEGIQKYFEFQKRAGA